MLCAEKATVCTSIHIGLNGPKDLRSHIRIFAIGDDRLVVFQSAIGHIASDAERIRTFFDREAREVAKSFSQGGLLSSYLCGHLSHLLSSMAVITLLTATDLKQKYQGEYQSWKNMKQRAKDLSKETSYAPELEAFDSFLSIVGPKPSPEHTLDRIDFTDPEYARGKIRWASKREQSENRASTVFIPLDGHLRTLRGWAETTGQPYDTLRTRYNKG